MPSQDCISNVANKTISISSQMLKLLHATVLLIAVWHFLCVIFFVQCNANSICRATKSCFAGFCLPDDCQFLDVLNCQSEWPHIPTCNPQQKKNTAAVQSYLVTLSWQIPVRWCGEFLKCATFLTFQPVRRIRTLSTLSPLLLEVHDLSQDGLQLQRRNPDLVQVPWLGSLVTDSDLMCSAN